MGYPSVWWTFGSPFLRDSVLDLFPISKVGGELELFVGMKIPQDLTQIRFLVVEILNQHQIVNGLLKSPNQEVVKWRGL